eukprot:3615289-Amphidinium_carterae.3
MFWVDERQILLAVHGDKQKPLQVPAWMQMDLHGKQITVLEKMRLVDKRSKGSEITGSRTTGSSLPNGIESDRVATYRSMD